MNQSQLRNSAIQPTVATHSICESLIVLDIRRGSGMKNDTETVQRRQVLVSKWISRDLCHLGDLLGGECAEGDKGNASRTLIYTHLLMTKTESLSCSLRGLSYH